MGTIVKRGDHQYRAQVRKKGQRSLSKTFELKRDAEDWIQEVERNIRRREIDGLDPKTQQTTVDQAVDHYEVEVMPTLARGGATQRAPLRRIRERFGPQFVSALRPPAVNTWTRDLTKKEELSAQSVVHHLNALSSLIRHANESMGVHLPAGNPARTAKRPALSASRERILLEGEFELLMRAARDPGDGPGQEPSPMLEYIVRLALETSMRQGELLALKWSWIDFRDLVIKIPAGATKTNTARKVALFPPAIEVLSELQGMPRHNSGRVFGCWSGRDSFQKPWQRLLRRARRIYEADCEAAGSQPQAEMLEDLRFHDLRHHATTELFSRGLNPFEVASMTGHKSMSMLKRYTHVDAAKLARKFSQPMDNLGSGRSSSG
jgi:integrase